MAARRKHAQKQWLTTSSADRLSRRGEFRVRNQRQKTHQGAPRGQVQMEGPRSRDLSTTSRVIC